MSENISWIAWLGIALVLGAIEIATVDFIFIMLAGGAVGGAGAAALGLGITGQVLTAAAVSVLLLGLVRPWAKKRFTVDKSNRPLLGVAGHVGRTATVVQTVTHAGGQVRIAGELWSARCDPTDVFAEGEAVLVTAIDGATAVVARIQTPQDDSGR